ncbi:MAG: alpha/beta hydrolase [Candidatus Bipolaricaulota bacterium]
MSGVKAPTFFIHGLKDNAVGYQNSEKLFEKKPQPKKMWLVPATAHVAAFENVPEQYKLRVLDFFRAYL